MHPEKPSHSARSTGSITGIYNLDVESWMSCSVESVLCSCRRYTRGKCAWDNQNEVCYKIEYRKARPVLLLDGGSNGARTSLSE